MSKIAQQLAGYVTPVTIGTLFATSRSALHAVLEKIEGGHAELQGIYDDLCDVRKLLPKEAGKRIDAKAILAKAVNVYQRLQKVKVAKLDDAKQWLAVAISQLSLHAEAPVRSEAATTKAPAKPVAASKGPATAKPAAATTASAAAGSSSINMSGPDSDYVLAADDAEVNKDGTTAILSEDQLIDGVEH